MTLKLKALSAAPAVSRVYIEDVFSTYLYTGNGSTQTITNGIDLAGEGGLVWIKSRSATTNHFLFDTVRGTTDEINSNTTDAEASLANSVTAFNADGFDIGSATGINVSAATYASWTFRKAEKFFDIVTYTGNGSNRTISHNLGSVPGCIMVKRTDTTGDWQVYHRSNTANPETDYLVLNSTAATADSDTRWADTAPTSTTFAVSTDATVNANGGTYVAYLFAHNAGGFGDDGSEDVISCGSFTTDASGNASISLGWEPQWVMLKATSSTSGWDIYDNIRGMPVGYADFGLLANTSGAEFSSTDYINPTATGFGIKNYGNSITWVYIAIRRGPMRQPTAGTEVFAPVAWTGDNVTGRNIATGFPVDLTIEQIRTGFIQANLWFDRLRGYSSTAAGNSYHLRSPTTDGEVALADYNYVPTMDGFNFGSVATGSNQYNNSGQTAVAWNFRRAPGFFDIVAYTGTGSARTIDHNLGVAPELMVVKKRSASDNWIVYAGDATDYLILNTTAATADLDTMWNDTAPTASVFSLGTDDDVNGNAATFVAYLFATLPGVSKIGSYTGNGSSQTIDCGFTGGARFVLIKRTDSTGDWLVGDTARGIVAGNDPYLELNVAAAEDTDEDWLDTDNSGFIVNETSTANANVNTATYIYLAIA